jgi:drug/metabolite transporter (DMT)-like permease
MRGPVSLTKPVAGRDRAIGVLCGIAVVLLFSSFTLVSRLGFASSLHLMDIAALRFGVSGALMAPVLWHYGLAGVRWRDAGALALCGGLGFALLALTGFSLAPASHGSVLLHGTLAVTTSVLAYITSRTRTTRSRAIGLLAILAGVIAMTWDSAARSSGRQLAGDGALLLASFSWSAYGLLARRLGLTPAHSSSLVAVISMCCFLPVYLAQPDWGQTIAAAGWKEVLLQALFQGALIGAASIFVYSRAVASLGAVETALFTAAVPPLTTFAAIFLLGEIPSPAAVVGVAVVTIGMAIAMKN